MATRTLVAYIIAPVLKVTGYRFSRTHRQNETIVYRMIDTVKANQLAN